MWNPFKNEKEELQKAQQEEASYALASQFAANPNAAMDEQNAIDKREVLVQLSQWQQDRSPVMRKLFYKLSGTYPDDKKGYVNQKWNRGYCTLLGSAKLVDFIEPLDHNVMLANWDTKNLIITLRDAIAHPLRRFIYQNHKDLGIDIEQAEYVFWMIVNTIEPNYWRGWNDGERRKDREIIKVNELRNPYYQQKKKGIFGIEAG